MGSKEIGFARASSGIDVRDISVLTRFPTGQVMGMFA